MIAWRGDTFASSNQPTCPSTLSPCKDVRDSTGAAALLAAEADEIRHFARVRLVSLQVPWRAFHGALTFWLSSATARIGDRVCNFKDESLSSLKPLSTCHRRPTLHPVKFKRSAKAYLFYGAGLGDASGGAIQIFDDKSFQLTVNHRGRRNNVNRAANVQRITSRASKA
jgi:hypothetical protein